MRSLFGSPSSFGMEDFKFNPDEYDPRLAFRRTRALRDIQEDHSDTMNELYRSGLMGTSAQFGVFDRQKKRGLNLLDDISADSLDKQFNYQLDRFNRLEDFKMRRSLMREQSSNDMEAQLLESLGGLGEHLLGPSLNFGLSERLAKLLEGY